LTELRERRDKKSNKFCRQEIINEINKKVEDLKPYIEERSQLTKTISKNPMCEERYYRFLKEPKGVIPTMLQNLLDARKHTRVGIKDNKKQIEKLLENGDKNKVNELVMLNNVLDKRQLAYKICANSVVATTPIPCKIDGKFIYKTIEEISKGDWARINEEQEVSTPIYNLEVWSDKGFTKPKFIMRHYTKEVLKRIVTDLGVVTCTNDHSLLKPNGDEIKPSECKIGDELMHEECKLELDNFNTLVKIPKEYESEFYKCSTEIESSKIFNFLRKSGFNVKIEYVNNEYLMEYSKSTLNVSNKIKKIEDVKAPQYVYDIETENHHFAAGVGNMIVHNSMYGSWGVKKGYLPFMPGAMCLLGDSLISHSFGFTRKMKDLVKTDNLWSYYNGQVVSNGKGLIYKGKRELVRITLIDGRILKCTPDHKIMTKSGWIEAGKLLPKHNWNGKVFNTNSEYSKVIVGLELPEDIIGEDEKNWKLLNYTMDTFENREKTLAFCRVLGFILSDGSISQYLGGKTKDKELSSCKVNIGTLIDSKLFVSDIKILTGQEPTISDILRPEIKGNVFAIHVPKILVDEILLIEGVLVGKRTHQPFTLPGFIFEPDCPLSVAREFLGGLFGGDGTSPSLSVSHPSFSPVEFGISTIEKYKDDMYETMNKITILLKRFEMDFWLREPRLAREREELLPKDIKENPRWEYIITTNSCFSLLFAQKIGFRYCSDKNNKLTVAASYQRYSDNVRKQHINIVLKTSEMYDLHDKHYKIKYILEKARKEIYENEIPLHEYFSLSKCTDVHNYRARPHTLEGFKLLKKYFPTAREYAQMAGCDHWFSEKQKSKKIYSIERDQKSNPCLYLDVVDVRYDGIDDVYDIIDVPNQSFVANGIVVHNCTTFMGRTNIEVVAKTIVEKYKGELVYGDTDSNYIHFPHLKNKTAAEAWDYAVDTAEKISSLFPRPIELAYEEQVYERFFILTKKRYMYKACGKDGIISDKIGKRGVLLNRRDSSIFIRNLYEKIVMKIMDKENRDEILYFILQELNRLCSNSVPYKDFVVTKSVGNAGNLMDADDNCKIEGDSVLETYIDEKGKEKIKLGDYIAPKLPKDQKEREKQFKLKDARTIKEYYERCLPAQVQLAEKMRRRGQIVQTGSRLEFLVTDIENHTAKQYEKLESMEYFLENSSFLTVDFFYYIKIAINSIDEILNIAFSKNDGNYPKPFKKDFIKEQYIFRYKKRRAVIEQIKNLFKPKISIG